MKSTLDLTSDERKLRMSIRNAYCYMNVPELENAKRMRTQINRSPFEIQCFDELIQEAILERDGK
jgi:hypothetical protein